MAKYNVLNSRARRVDGPAKATGKAVYTDDITLPGMLYGAILHSTEPHARILSIDTSAAEALPGVKAVLTGKNVPSTKYGVSPARYDENILAVDRVRYMGDEVAAVAADGSGNRPKGRLELIKVEYEPLGHTCSPWRRPWPLARPSSTRSFRATSPPRCTRSSARWTRPSRRATSILHPTP